jgi:hypothetical protein
MRSRKRGLRDAGMAQPGSRAQGDGAQPNALDVLFHVSKEHSMNIQMNSYASRLRVAWRSFNDAMDVLRDALRDVGSSLEVRGWFRINSLEREVSELQHDRAAPGS